MGARVYVSVCMRCVCVRVCVCVCWAWACSWACSVMREDSASATEPQTCLVHWRYMGWPGIWTQLDKHRQACAHTHTHLSTLPQVHMHVNQLTHTKTHKNTDKYPRDSKGRADEDVFLTLTRSYTVHHPHKGFFSTWETTLCTQIMTMHLFFVSSCFKANQTK